MRPILSRFLAWLALAAALLPLAACYESDQEIIPVELGEPLPYRGDTIRWARDEETRIERFSPGNDYRFEDRRDGDTNNGTFRALRLKDDIFAVQVASEDARYVQILFYRVSPDAVTRMDVAVPTEVPALAARNRVMLRDTGMGYVVLEGAPGDMLAFLRGHAQLAFTVWQKA